MKKLITIILVLACLSVQASKRDSLLSVYQDKNQPDTVRLKAIFTLAQQHVFRLPDSAMFYAKKTLALALQKNREEYVAEAYQTMGTANYGLQQIDTAIVYYQKALVLYKKLSIDNGTAAVYNNMGIMYEIKSQYALAIDCYLQGIKIRERQNNINSMAKLNINIGNVYIQLKDFEKAREYYNKARAGFVEIKDSTGLAQTFMAMGLSFEQETDSAIYFLNQSLLLHQKLNNLKGVNQCKSNLGSIYQNKGDLQMARTFFQEALDHFENTNDIINKATLYEDFGSLYVDLKQYQKGISLCTKSLALAQDYGLREINKFSCLCLYEANLALNNTSEALKYYKRYTEVKDSIVNDDITKQIAQAELQYEYDKKLFADSLNRAEQERIKEMEHEREVQQQKTYSYVGAVGAALLLIILLILFRGYNQKKKSNVLLEQKNELISHQKREVEIQKELVEEKSKEITDSIAYAKNIQDAILPPMSLFDEHLNDGFVYFNPKDVVSGDFYWLESVKKNVFFAVADCTGHGVPGAMVSVVCANALSRSVKEFDLKEPGEILNKARELVIETFAKSDREVKDGMDISLCAWDGTTLKFAGAHNPLWILRKGASQMEEIKGDKQPVGKHINTNPFTTYKVNMNTGDLIYLFTDGFPDQFGGEKGKKLKYKPFQHILINHALKSTDEQKVILSQEFQSWKGTNEQIDDVCVMCVKL